MNEINHIVDQLKAELNEMGNEDLTSFNNYEKPLESIRTTLQELKKIVLSKNFSNTEHEVLFFKEIKPFIMSRFLFLTFVIQYDNLYFISAKSAEDHAKKTLKEKKSFLSTYKTYLIQLRNCNQKESGKYFVRNQFSPPICPIYSEVLLNTQFSTFHSEVLSIFQSYNLIQNFLDRKNQNPTNLTQPTQLKWTQNKTALIELIYALHCSSSINSGRGSIKDLKNIFESIFNVNLGNVYRAFHDFKRREVRTPFIENLRKAMESKLDEDDAFYPK
jgi:hypothetical protein